MNETFVGNNLEETAYHEAGHVVVAAALGLELRIRGITIYEVSSDVMDGLACYWDDETDWEKNLQALLGGQIAQWRKFPETNLVDGSRPDRENFTEKARQHFAGSSPSDVWARVRDKVHALFDVAPHWSAGIEIADTLITAPWADETEHPFAKRKKHLDGAALVAILAAHGISARLR